MEGTIEVKYNKADPSYDDPMLTLIELESYVDNEMLNIDILVQDICKRLSVLTVFEDTDFEPRTIKSKNSTFYGRYNNHLTELVKLHHRLENIESQLRHRIGGK